MKFYRFFIKIIFLLSFIVFPNIFHAQDENLRHENWIYKDNIKSVKFHIEGLFTSYPIVNLGSGTRLELSFDDLDGDVKNYVYTIVHCDADWTPSDLIDSEYIEGFFEEEIDDYEYSFNTEAFYTHYKGFVPNEDLRYTRSGNYVLKVYEDEDEKTLALTRRFMVVEPIMRIYPDMVRPSMVGKIKTHQEIDFKVTHEGIEVRNPRTEMFATILQNGRWDNTIFNVPPQFTRAEEQLFTYQNKIVFPAGREFRHLDMRSFDYGSENIRQIDRIGNTYDVTLYLGKKRIKQPHLDLEDLNGDFVIENFDRRDHDLEGEYANVLFSLYSPTELYDTEVYIFGGLTDWKLKPEFKMVYNPAIFSYVGKAQLKQGYYDYLYVTVPEQGGKPSLEETEGNWFETENYYTVLLYYRPFGSRYDRLVGARTFSSRM